MRNLILSLIGMGLIGCSHGNLVQIPESVFLAERAELLKLREERAKYDLEFERELSEASGMAKAAQGLSCSVNEETGEESCK